MHSKNIIITGVSRGIGFELVKQLTQAGHQVLALSRNIDPLDAFACDKIRVDIANPEELVQVKDFVAEHWDQIDVLIHNAGRLINKPFAETTSHDFMDVYKVNVFAVADLTRLLLPWLKKNSHVVTISSMGGIQGSLKFPGLLVLKVLQHRFSS